MEIIIRRESDDKVGGKGTVKKGKNGDKKETDRGEKRK